MSDQAREAAVSVRLLGSLEVARAGRMVPLPASKRTRALLGYLVDNANFHSREHLCDLFWDGPDDPRAALRWSLTKLRPVVNDASVRLTSDRERIRFISHDAQVDVDRVRVLLAAGVNQSELPALEEASALLMRGEFLDGLDLPRCYRFHHWCMAERERFGSLHRQVLNSLIERLEGSPELVLRYVHALVAADPLSEAAHAKLIDVLASAGRHREADAHYAYARELLQRELAAPLVGLLQLGSGGNGSNPSHDQSLKKEPGQEVRNHTEPSNVAPEIVGHEIARCKLNMALQSLSVPTRRSVLMLDGQPGIGKSRLLKMTIDNAAATGVRVISARCFEAETVRPYGIWLDALRALPFAEMPDAIKQEVAAVPPGIDRKSSGERGRARLFRAIVDLITRLSSQRPLVIALDDLQWIDEGSASLLHFLVRTLGPSCTLFVAATRTDEVDDNPWAKRLLLSLKRDRSLDKVTLAPLNRDQTAFLLGAGATESVISSIYRESGGNPLFILELARARLREGDTENFSLEMLVEERLDRLDPQTREVVKYAAAIGREFRPEILGAAIDVPEPLLMERLDRLQRRSLLSVSAEGYFDFCHDLIRNTTYRALSQPWRRMIHRRIAAALSEAASAEPSYHGDLVHHAGLAEDFALASRSSVAAGERCLRVFANSEASAVADRGLIFLQHLPRGPERIRMEIALLDIKVQGAFHAFAVQTSKSQVAQLCEQLRRAADEAEAMGLPEDNAKAHHAIAWLTWRSNESETAHLATLEAERASRAGDAATRCQQLANTARCLLDVEADIQRAREFVQAAATLSDQINLQLVELEWGQGLLARWDGDLVGAHAHTTRALKLARMRENRWREIECLLWLTKIDFELENYSEVVEHCDAMIHLANRICGAHAPIARALRVLALQRGCTQGAPRDLDEILTELRGFDDKANLAYCLNECAALEFCHGETRLTQAYAGEALTAACAVQRPTEVAVASATLLCAASANRDRTEMAQQVANIRSLGDPRQLSFRARSRIRFAFQQSKRRLPANYLS